MKIICFIEDNKEAYKLMFRASEIDPSNGFATQQIAPLMNQFSQMNQQRISQGQQPMPLPDFLKALSCWIIRSFYHQTFCGLSIKFLLAP